MSLHQSHIHIGRNIWFTALGISILTMIMIFNFIWSTRDQDLKDFGSFIASGQLASRGENPYSTESPLIFHVEFNKLGLKASLPNLNPPISILFAQLLATFDPVTSLLAWKSITAILYFLCVLALMLVFSVNSTILRIFWAFSLAGFWHTIELGQIYAPLALFSTGAFIFFMKQKWGLAGILIGCMVAIKPNFIIWPVFLLLGNYIPTALVAFATAGAISLLPLLIYSPQIYSQWIQASINFSALSFPGNSSLVGLVSRFGLPVWGEGLALLITLIFAVLIYFKRPNLLTINASGLLISLLASPIAWVGYTITLLPFLYAKHWRVPESLAGLILIIPFPVVLSYFENSQFNFIFWGWLYGFALVILSVSVLFDIFHNSSLDPVGISIQGSIRMPS
jgi:hypothetical protein